MIDIHVHMSRGSSDREYFLSQPREIEHLESIAAVTSSIRRFAVFPHYFRDGYCQEDANLSLLSLPERFVPFFRFKLARRLGMEARLTRAAGVKSCLKYMRAKLRLQPCPSEFEAVMRIGKQHGVRGYKFHDGQDGSFDAATLAAILRERAVLVLHSYPCKIRCFIEEGAIPPGEQIRGAVVFAHFGYSLINPAAEVPDILWLNRHAGDWLKFDTSFVGTLPALRPVLEPCLDRLVFGSDFPAVSPEASLSNLLAIGKLLGVQPDSTSAVLERNSATIESLLGTDD
jgi:hypothetical protein